MPEPNPRKNWALLRLGFRCYCPECSGRFWQAKYGEGKTTFRKRYEREHARKPILYRTG